MSRNQKIFLKQNILGSDNDKEDSDFINSVFWVKMSDFDNHEDKENKKETDDVIIYSNMEAFAIWEKKPSDYTAPSAFGLNNAEIPIEEPPYFVINPIAENQTGEESSVEDGSSGEEVDTDTDIYAALMADDSDDDGTCLIL